METINIVRENPVYSQKDVTDVQDLGRGVFASVFKVEQQRGDNQKTQVVRVLHSIRNHYALKREKDLLQYLNQFTEDFPHFNEIRKDGFHYLQFFDFVGKQTLHKRVNKKGGLPESDVKNLLANMVSTLKHVHGVGFIHADIKPENIVYGNRRYYLVDWSQAMPSLSSFETEVITGDKRYCPPERLNGEYSVSGDIYALGCTLYYALTGKHIYRLDKVPSGFDQLYAHAFHTPRKLNKLPVFWRQLIVWMTLKDPEKRPGLADLASWLDDGHIPDEIRHLKLEAYHDFPKDSLDALANEHYLYALFKKATLHEAAGELETAFNLYENCAFHGYTRAENNLGLMYEKGAPVRQSYIQAMNNYHQAFQKGNPFAALNLARIFEEGLDVDKNFHQAYKLYKFAAMRGNLLAQNKLGECYWHGKGVAVDVVQARYWFGLAAHYGLVAAMNNIKSLLADTVKQA